MPEIEIVRRPHEPPIPQFMTITPALAQVWYEARNPANRAISKATIKSYSTDLQSGSFILNPADAICFDWNAVLINGQHRLKSCIDTGISFDALVVFNCDPDSFRVMDSGRKRTSADDMHLMGHGAISKELSYVGRLFLLAERKMLISRPTLTRSEIQACVLRNGGEFKAALDFVAELEFATEFTPGRMAFCFLWFARQDRFKAAEFIKTIARMTNLSDGHPVLLLRKALDTARKQKRQIRDDIVLPLVFKAWVMYRDDRTGHYLKVTKGEAWDRIEGKVVTGEQSSLFSPDKETRSPATIH